MILLKVKGFFCLFVAEDLANRWTVTVLLFSSYIDPRKFCNYFGGRYLHPPNRNRPLKILPQVSCTDFYSVKVSLTTEPIKFPIFREASHITLDGFKLFYF